MGGQWGSGQGSSVKSGKPSCGHLAAAPLYPAIAHTINFCILPWGLKNVLLMRVVCECVRVCVSVCADLNSSAEEACKQAMANIFVRKAEVHRFAMPNQSRKNPHKARWTLFEMWPISVSTAACVSTRVTMQMCGSCDQQDNT